MVEGTRSTVDVEMTRDAFRLADVVVTGQATTVERRSATTTQGYEWLGEPHRRQHTAEAELRTCQTATDVAGCVAAWLDQHVATHPSVVYVDDDAGQDDLAAQLVAEHGYIVLYDNEAGTIVTRGG